MGGERRQLLAAASIVNKRARPHPTASRVRHALYQLVPEQLAIAWCGRRMELVSVVAATPSPGNSLHPPRDMLLPDRKGLPVTTSKTIAGLIGLTLVAIAAAMLFNFGSFPALAEQISRDPGLIT